MRGRVGLRFLLGCLVVVLAAGGAAAVTVIEQVHTIVQDISVTKPLAVKSKALAVASFGQPENLLLIGDDTRSVFKYYNAFVPNLANEMLVVRIDPAKPYISMLSLPRELWVPITPTYTNRLNSAYTLGTTVLLQTIKSVTGLSINHVIATTFTQFENAIDTLGCVYDTIDERYYHNNADGGDQYQNVDLQPGYQCLNGSDAEQFVSYRHTDTSQVRDSRDQNFLLAVKAQYGPLLSSHISQFEKVFGETVQTDTGLRSDNAILSLVDLLINAEGLTVRQVPFQTDPCSTTCPSGDLTASPQQISASVDSFLHGTTVAPKHAVAEVSHHLDGRHGLANLSLLPTLPSNLSVEAAAASKLQFTAEFPKVQQAGGTAIPLTACNEYASACVRNYLIHAPNGDAYPIYVAAYSDSLLGQFYDVQGTTWSGLPLLAHPDQTVKVGHRVYELFYNGAHLETVAWRQYGATYWVHNTLGDTLNNDQMLALGQQTVAVGPIRAQPTHVTLTAFTVRPSTKPLVVAAATPSWTDRLGGLVALALALLALLAAVLQRRRVRRIRAELAETVSRTQALEARASALRVTRAGVAAAARTPVAVGAGVSGADALGDRFGGEGVGTEFGAKSASFSAQDAPMTVHRSRSRRIRIWMAVVGLLVVAVVAAAVIVLARDAHAAGSGRAHNAAPTVAVAVLNAGQVEGAARTLAGTLAHRHVNVVAVGNLLAHAPRHFEVLYKRGDRGQAGRLAALLVGRHPSVLPLSTAGARQVGTTARLVVVIAAT